MDEREFTIERTGKIIWESKGAYYWFKPKKLPYNIKENPKLRKQADKTLLALGNLSGFIKKFEKEEIILYQTPFMIKEAQLSSEIEGTRTTISDVLKEEKIEEKDPEKRLDNEEIRNYKKALVWALENMPKEFTEEYMKKIHEILLEGVRGSNKEPGKYKTVQNAIGIRTDSLDTAKFVPALPEVTKELMKNLLEYINHNDENEIELYKVGITHYQFEAIHPFRDGNGRLGRMLIVLQLVKEGLLSHPLLYISEYFTRNRSKYIELLYNTSSKGELEEWMLFFLKGLEEQAKKSLELLTKIDEYKKELHKKINGISSNPRIHNLIDQLFKQPYITVEDVKEVLKVTYSSAWEQVKKMVKADILKEVDTEGRKKVYLAYKIMELLEK